MSLSINNGGNNLNSYQEYLNKKKEKEKSQEKLSSGYDINSASDDPARLAVSEKMRNEITIAKASQTNAAMASNAVKTAEGAMQSVNDMLVRANELSTLASNGTYTDDDRAALQSEFTQIVDEINRIAETTNFNGIEMLDGSLSATTSDGMQFEIDGSSLASADISINLDSVSMSFHLDASQLDITTQEQAQEILSTLEDFVTKITSQRADLGATENRLDHASSNLSTMELYLQQAESKMRDTDMAKEASEDNKNAVSLKSATSVMQQAQKDKESILNILGS